MPTEPYLELARHAAAILDEAAWRSLVDLSRKLTRDMTLGDVDAVATALERRIEIVERLFALRPAGETVH